MRSSHLPTPSSRAQALGFGWLFVQLAVLPSLLTLGNAGLGRPLDLAQLNFVYYLLNFLAVSLIFRRIFQESLANLKEHPWASLRTALLGLLAYGICFWGLSALGDWLLPDFSNQNDAAIFSMTEEHFLLMVMGTVFLVPPAEECLYRGLIFRKFYGLSPWKAYGISSLIFACIHVLGYLGQYSGPELLFAVAQYLPAGWILAWSYARSSSIFVPICIHAAVNLLTILTAR